MIPVVCVCMCVYARVCVYVRMCSYVRMCVHMKVFACMRVGMRVYICVCVFGV